MIKLNGRGFQHLRLISLSEPLKELLPLTAKRYAGHDRKADMGKPCMFFLPMLMKQDWLSISAGLIIKAMK